MDNELLRQHDGHVTHLTLNRPQKANAQSEWPALIGAARTEAGLLTYPATARLYEQTVADTRAADMAALVQSASMPGLKERIRMFRASNP